MDMTRVKKKNLAGGHGFDFGARLREVRKKKGLTQEQLAERMDVTHRAITYYEGEATNPSIQFMEQAAKALNVSKGLLLGLDAKAEVQEVPSVIKPLKERLGKLSSLTKKDQEALVAVLDGFLLKNKISG